MTCQVQPLRYGSFNFSNLFLKTSTSSQTMLADDGIAAKYIKTTITTEFVYSVNQAQIDASGVTSADAFMDTVFNELSKPGQALTYNYRGFGTAFATAETDVVYGPYPKVLEWEPLGSNLTVRVVWTVEFATNRCPIAITPSLDTANTFQILQLVEDSTLSFDEDGAVVIQTNGTLEIAGNSFNSMEKLKEFARWFFPNELTTFHRKHDLTLRKDKRTVDYRITDTELKTDNPMFPYMVSQDVTHSIGSSLFGDVTSGAGFRSWLNKLSGSFRVRPGVWKGWAWIAFLYVMAQRRDRAVAANKTNTIKMLDEFNNPDGADPSGGDIEGESREERKKPTAKQFPISVEIKESIYGREVDLNSEWITFCSLYDLFRSTGMFYPVDSKFTGVDSQITPDIHNDTAATKATQWSLWKSALGPTQGSKGYRNVGLAGFDMVFDPCNRDSASQTVQSSRRNSSFLSQETPSEFDSSWDYYEYGNERIPLGKVDSELTDPSYSSTSKYLEGLSAANSWIDYKVKTSVVETTNSTYIPTHDNYDLESLNAGTSELVATTKNAQGLVLNGQTSSSYGGDWSKEVIQVFGKPVYKIRVKGYAIRLAYQIPTPVMLGVLKGSTLAKVYRVGEQKWEHSLLTVSDEVPVFLAKWDQVYALPFDPSTEDLRFKTSGQPAEFA